MRSVTRSVFVVCAGLLFSTAVRAQPGQQAVYSFTAVDRVFQINGVYRPTDGKAAAAVESVTFSIYAEATGGMPIWQETQSVTVDSQGRYSALLGVTTDGLPVDLFASSEPRWLGLQFLRKGEAELPRTLATSVPYAIKAAKASDADTLGGLPASAFLRNDGDKGSGGAAGVNRIADPPNAGTIGRIGKFVTATELGDSVITESAGKIGVGTTTPFDFMHTRFTDTAGGFTGYPCRTWAARPRPIQACCSTITTASWGISRGSTTPRRNTASTMSRRGGRSTSCREHVEVPGGQRRQHRHQSAPSHLQARHPARRF